jgi:hypothetical protein
MPVLDGYYPFFNYSLEEVYLVSDSAVQNDLMN